MSRRQRYSEDYSDMNFDLDNIDWNKLSNYTGNPDDCEMVLYNNTCRPLCP